MSDAKDPLDGPGSFEAMRADITANRLTIGGYHVMESWETPVMQGMVDDLRIGGESDVLEIGFGLGISAAQIAEKTPRSYTVIELHPDVADRAEEWAAGSAIQSTTVVRNAYQSAAPRMQDNSFDAIFFDPYPNDAHEWALMQSDFMPTAHRLLRPKGRLAYLPMEAPSTATSGHVSRCLDVFGNIELRVVRHALPPIDCDYWQLDHMIVAAATKAAN